MKKRKVLEESEVPGLHAWGMLPAFFSCGEASVLPRVSKKLRRLVSAPCLLLSAHPEQLARYVEQQHLDVVARAHKVEEPVDWVKDEQIRQCNLMVGRLPSAWKTSRRAQLCMQFSRQQTDLLVNGFFAPQEVSKALALPSIDTPHIQQPLTVTHFPYRMLEPCHLSLLARDFEVQLRQVLVSALTTCLV